MTFPTAIWLLFAAAMVISSIGFYKYVWFISLGTDSPLPVLAF